jgi:Flp pilus assembly protein TadG
VKALRSFAKDERGSISLLIMSLFMSTLIVLVILTNISSIYLAKRALTQASEAAVQRGVRNLDLQRYYQSDYNFWQFAWNLTGEGETDPGIPIDCPERYGEMDAAQ